MPKKKLKAKVLLPAAPVQKKARVVELVDSDLEAEENQVRQPQAQGDSDSSQNNQENYNPTTQSSSSSAKTFRKIRNLLAPILNRAQETDGRGRAKLLKDVKNAYENSGATITDFARVFFRMMAVPFNDSGPSGNPYLKKVCEFYKWLVNEIRENDELDNPTQFQIATLNSCLKHYADIRKHTRERIYEVVLHILNKIGQDCCEKLPNEIVVDLKVMLMLGLKDQDPKVRFLAARSLENVVPSVYQPGLILIDQLALHSRDDPSHDARRAALWSCRFGPENFEVLNNAVFDKNELVRQTVFKVIRRDGLLHSMDLTRRECIIEAGLKDYNEFVRIEASKTLVNFLEQKCDNNIVKLLRRFDTYWSKKLCYTILKTLIPDSQALEKFDISFLNSNGLISYDILTNETIFFWLFLIGNFKNRRGLTIPTATEMCNYLIGYKEFLESDENSVAESGSYSCDMLNCLLFILILLPVEESGRQQIGNLAHELIKFKYIEPSNSKYLVRLVYHSCPPNIEVAIVSLLQQFLDCFGLGKEPEPRPSPSTSTQSHIQTLTQDDLTQLKVEVGLLIFQRHRKLDQMNAASEALDFVTAHKLKQEIDELSKQIENLKSQVDSQISSQWHSNVPVEADRKEDEQSPDNIEPTQLSLKFAFSALVFHLKSTNSDRMTSVYTKKFLDKYFDLAIVEDDFHLRQLALEAKLLIGLYNSDDAEAVIITCIKAFHLDPDQSVRITAFKCIIDLILVYGLDKFELEHIQNLASEMKPSNLDGSGVSNTSSTSSGLETTNFFNVFLTNTLTSSDRPMHYTGIEGLLKLLFAKRIRNPKWICKLLLLWVNPVFAKTKVIKNLDVFFPMYVRQGVGEFTTVINCVPECLGKIIYSQPSSPFHVSDADTENSPAHDLIRFVATCTEQKKLKTTYDNPWAPHELLIDIMLKELKKNCPVEEVAAYIKSLKFINLEGIPGSSLKDILKKIRCLKKKHHVPVQLKTSLKEFELYLERLEMDPLYNLESNSGSTPADSKSATITNCDDAEMSSLTRSFISDHEPDSLEIVEENVDESH